MLTCLGATVLAISIIVYSILTKGWILSVFWKWFIIPVFPNAPVLTLFQALGLSLVLSFITHKREKQEDIQPGTKEFYTESIKILITPWFMYIIGYIVWRLGQ